MSNVIKFPKVKKSRTKIVQSTTLVMVVDFKKKELVGEAEFDNIQEMIVASWGKKISRKKQAA